jgi:hypothetical protein
MTFGNKGAEGAPPRDGPLGPRGDPLTPLLEDDDDDPWTPLLAEEDVDHITEMMNFKL